ncbi:MAG: class I SAM-dependent methyltransferase [Phototrophicaceae bacterium]|jgi:2-polyprenyl-3-methyl-5-hydroxy-6-metoxy-1,4-benzoquinol methylase
MPLLEIPHPHFIALLQASDAELISQDLRALEHQLIHAQNFQEEGLWSDALMEYIQQAGVENYVHLHWVAEQYYAQKLISLAHAPDFGYYYLVGYARIVALVLRYHENMGYDRNDYFFIRGFLEHAFPTRRDLDILEIGAGSGKLLADLGRLGYGQVEGMEMSAAALREARANIAGVLPLERLHAMSFEDFRTNYPERRYDVVVHAHLIEHIPPHSVPSFLAEARAVLKPHGYMVVITPSRLSGPHDVTRYFREGGAMPEGFHLHEFTLRELEAVLRPAGFGNIATVKSLPTLNSWWDASPTEASFIYKRDLEAFLMNLSWEQRKPIVDGMYYVGLVCQRTD